MKIMSFWWEKIPQRVARTDATPFLSDDYPRWACRKAESAGNGVLPSGEKNFSVHRTYMNFLRPRKRALETARYALRGILLPENGTDATPFLSDVYNKGTRASKRLADVSLYTLLWILPQNATDTTQPDDDVYNLGTRRGRMLVDGELSGRSMVEMLGVLAIIGVLSVGAINGYHKAMLKYQLNKQADAVNTLINHGFQINSKLPVYAKMTIHDELFNSLGLIPDGMTYTKPKIHDNFNNLINIYSAPPTWGYKMGIALVLTKSPYNFEICQNIYKIAKEWHSEISYAYINQYKTDGSINSVSQYYGDKYQPSKKYLLRLRNLEITNLDSICRVCEDTTECRLFICWG